MNSSGLPLANGSCFTDRALAPFEPCRSKCVSHAKWRTDVVYGQSNIVLGCLRRTWWYGANRGICQMQSGVMEGRDRAGGNRGGGVRGWTAWALPNSLRSISCGGTKHACHPPPLHEDGSALRGEYLPQQTLITQEPISKSHHSASPWAYLHCRWFTARTEMLDSKKEKRCTSNAQIF